MPEIAFTEDDRKLARGRLAILQSMQTELHQMQANMNWTRTFCPSCQMPHYENYPEKVVGEKLRGVINQIRNLREHIARIWDVPNPSTNSNPIAPDPSHIVVSGRSLPDVPTRDMAAEPAYDV